MHAGTRNTPENTLTLAKSRGKLAASAGLRPICRGCCCLVATLLLAVEVTARDEPLPRTGPKVTNALDPAAVMPKNAIEAFILQCLTTKSDATPPEYRQGSGILGGNLGCCHSPDNGQVYINMF